jgi:hypothetical protein
VARSSRRPSHVCPGLPGWWAARGVGWKSALIAVPRDALSQSSRERRSWPTARAGQTMIEGRSRWRLGRDSRWASFRANVRAKAPHDTSPSRLRYSSVDRSEEDL